MKPGDPNYALLDKATAIIQRFLDSFHSDPGVVHSDLAHAHGQSRDDANEDWTALLSQDLWDWDAGFWQGLADHPSFGVLEPPLPDV